MKCVNGRANTKSRMLPGALRAGFRTRLAAKVPILTVRIAKENSMLSALLQRLTGTLLSTERSGKKENLWISEFHLPKSIFPKRYREAILSQIDEAQTGIMKTVDWFKLKYQNGKAALAAAS